MYHRFGPIESEEGAAPKYAQIYLFDKAEAAEFREAYAMGKARSAPTPDLHVMLGKCNPTAQAFYGLRCADSERWAQEHAPDHPRGRRRGRQ